MVDDGGLASVMTLRDWFAGQIVSQYASDNLNKSLDDIAISVYLIADALIRVKRIV